LRAREPRRRAGWCGRKCCSCGRFLRSGGDLGSIIRPSSAASSGRWPMARSRHSMTGRDPDRSRRSHRKRRFGWCPWRATRPRSKAITRALDDATAGTPCAQAWAGSGTQVSRQSGARHRVQDSWSRGDQTAQGALLLGAPGRGVRPEDGASSLRLSRGPGPEMRSAIPFASF
jgi:hypothetical protein